MVNFLFWKRSPRRAAEKNLLPRRRARPAYFLAAGATFNMADSVGVCHAIRSIFLSIGSQTVHSPERLRIGDGTLVFRSEAGCPFAATQVKHGVLPIAGSRRRASLVEKRSNLNQFRR